MFSVDEEESCCLAGHTSRRHSLRREPCAAATPTTDGFERLHEDAINADDPVGLGPMLVRRIVEDQGVAVPVRTVKDEVTAICFTWPKVADE